MHAKGEAIRFEEDGQPYTVRAEGGAFAICTRPSPIPDKVFYTIVDYELEIRGTDNLVFGIYDYETDEGCEANLQLLLSGEMEITTRNRTPLTLRYLSESPPRPMMLLRFVLLDDWDMSAEDEAMCREARGYLDFHEEE